MIGGYTDPQGSTHHQAIKTGFWSVDVYTIQSCFPSPFMLHTESCTLTVVSVPKPNKQPYYMQIRDVSVWYCDYPLQSTISFHYTTVLLQISYTACELL